MVRLDPRLIVIVESDFWPNHLFAARRRGVPVGVINAKLSDRSFRLHHWSRIVPRALRSVSLVAAQTAEHAARFEGLGVPPERVTVTGNMKYDQTVDDQEAGLRSALRRRLGYPEDACVIVGGSLHPGEDQDLLAAFRQVLTRQPSARLAIVPRYPESASAVLQNVRAAGYPAVAKSQLDSDPERAVRADEIVVVDVLGELRKFYTAADVAFVGGSLYFRGSNKGGHNLMEPAIRGLPVLFGPHNFSFRETVADLLAADAGMLVRDRAELAAALSGLADSDETRHRMGSRARRVVLERQGASRRNLELLLPLLDAAPGCSPTPQQAKCRHQPQTQVLNE
jgi:3-deoxy-D-manno-octulosonic-acid transferase